MTQKLPPQFLRLGFHIHVELLKCYPYPKWKYILITYPVVIRKATHIRIWTGRTATGAHRFSCMTASVSTRQGMKRNLTCKGLLIHVQKALKAKVLLLERLQLQGHILWEGYEQFIEEIAKNFYSSLLNPLESCVKDFLFIMSLLRMVMKVINCQNSLTIDQNQPATLFRFSQHSSVLPHTGTTPNE